MKRRLKSTRHYLRETVKEVYTVLYALGLRIHPVRSLSSAPPRTTGVSPWVSMIERKTVATFRESISSTSMAVSRATLSRQGDKVTRLYERGMSKECVAAYFRRWPGWAVVLVVVTVAGGCAGPRRVECGAGLTAEWDGGRDDRGKDHGTWETFKSACKQEMCKKVDVDFAVITGTGKRPEDVRSYPYWVFVCDDEAAVRRCADERACGELRRGQSK